MAKKKLKNKKDMTYLELYKYINGIKGAIAYLNIATLGAGVYIKREESYFDELDAKTRELGFIKDKLDKLPTLKKAFAMKCDLTRLNDFRKENKLTHKGLAEVLKEETYYLFHHIVGYEERCEE